MDPKELVRKIRKIDPSCISNDPSKTKRNPNKTITCLVRKYAKSVGDDERAKNFSANGLWPEEHQENAIEAIADMAEFEGYNFLEVWHAE